MLQYQVAYLGVTLGNGTPVNLSGITGLRALAPLRTGDVPRGSADGNFSGLNYLDARMVHMDFLIAATTNAETAIRSVASVFGVNITDATAYAMTVGRYLTGILGGNTLPPSMLTIQLPGRTYPIACFGRPDAFDLPIDDNYQYGWVAVSAEFKVPDGVLYDLNVQQATCGLQSPTAGLRFPVTFPATFGSSSGGSVSVNNTGTYRTHPVIRFTGPCTTPVATLNSTGQYVGVNIGLAAGDTVIVDTQAGTITLNGTALRNNNILPGSTFFTLPTGAQSVGFSTSDAITVAGTMTVAAMPAYSGI